MFLSLINTKFSAITSAETNNKISLCSDHYQYVSFGTKVDEDTSGHVIATLSMNNLDSEAYEKGGDKGIIICTKMESSNTNLFRYVEFCIYWHCYIGNVRPRMRIMRSSVGTDTGIYLVCIDDSTMTYKLMDDVKRDGYTSYEMKIEGSNANIINLLSDFTVDAAEYEHYADLNTFISLNES